jgi:hypothetical protein
MGAAFFRQPFGVGFKFFMYALPQCLSLEDLASKGINEYFFEQPSVDKQSSYVLCTTVLIEHFLRQG